MNIAMSPPKILRRMLSLCALMPALLVAAEPDIDHLMLSLAKAKPPRVSFVEKKFIAILDRPVESSGELAYSPPDHLEKRTIKPKPETMIVDGDTLVLERGRKKHTVQLQDYPEIAGFLDSFRGTLSGDRTALERSFRLRLEGTNERWILTLLPKDTKLATLVNQIKIAGVRDNVRSVEVMQADGDRSLMTIESINAQ